MLANVAQSNSERGRNLKAVARAAGVSIATASCALNNHPRVALRTRDRVCEAARRLGFVNSGNYAARRLRRSRADSRVRNFDIVGLISRVGARVGTRIDLDLAALAMMHGMEHELSRLHASLMFVRVDEPQDWEKVHRLNRAGLIDGWLMMGDVDDAGVERVKPSGTPLVIVGDHRCSRPLHAVNVDHAAVGRVAAQHLASLGHCRIGFLGGSMNFVYQQQTLAGFREGLRAAGADEDERLVANGTLWGEATEERLVHWLSEVQPMPTALFVAEFDGGASTCRLLKRRGIEVPDQVSVLGCGAVFTMKTFQQTTRLSVVEIPLAEVGRHAASLLHRIATEPGLGFLDLKIAPSLVEGWSTSAWRRDESSLED